MKYAVIIEKRVYVEADSADEARDKAIEGDTVSEVEDLTEVLEVDDFVIDMSGWWDNWNELAIAWEDDKNENEIH